MEDTSDPYSQWKTDPTPAALAKVVEHLSPTLNSTLGTIGAADDHTIRTKGRAIMAKAIKTYDPVHGASLPTYVSSQLRGLSRYKRKTQGIGLPERTQLDNWAIHRGTQELTDKLNRDPDVSELADHIGLPVKRIADVRRAANRAVTSEEAGLSNTQEDDHIDEAASYLIPELDHIGRKVLEHRTGYGGAQIKDAAVLAAELGVSAPTISRKSAYIYSRLHDIRNILQEVYQ